MMEAPPMMCYSRGVIDSLVGKLTDVKETHPKVGPLLKDLVRLRGDLVNKCAGATHPQVKVWMKQNRQLFYDIEDMIDLKLVKTKDVHESEEDFGEQIKEFGARIKEARDRSERYDLPKKANTTSDADRQEEKGVLVGIGGPRKELEDYLTDTQKKKKVVSVLGIGGLGKTTLATKVYEEIKAQFECHASVTVGRNSSIVALRDVFRQVNPEMVDQDLNEPVIIVPKLWNFLKNKRYLVFVDDIQNEHAWRVINRALPNNELGSRILVTTRVKNVAMLCSVPPIDVIYEMKRLKEHDSKTLLDRMMPTQTRVSFEKKCHDMLKMCCDVPLAIIVTSGLLAHLKYADLGSLKKLEESTVSMMDQYSPSDGLRNVLDICFADLSPPVKACFLYLSTFPENYTIKKGRLIWRWVAEGFIPKTSQASMWKTGESYFNELVCRRLIRPDFDDYSDDQAEACTVHPVIHDFIASLSREEDFHTTAAELISGPFPYGTIRWFSVDCRSQENNEADTLQSSGIYLSRVRSLTVFGAAGCVHDLGTFKYLRVLDLEDTKSLDDEQAEKIEYLFLLRYLGLAGTKITNLPQQIMALQHLVTLDLRRTEVRELPSFENNNLLSLFAPLITIPREMGAGMEKLEELSEVLVGRDDLLNLDGSHAADVAELVKKSRRLRVLGVKFGYLAKIDEAVGMKHFLKEVRKSDLQSLSLDDYPCDSIHLLYQCCAREWLKFELRMSDCLPLVPLEMASIEVLTHLHIQVKVVQTRDVHILGNLPNLILLKLFSKEGTHERLSIGSEVGFRFLMVFWFRSSCFQGMELQFEKGAMPRLQRLKIEFNARKTEFNYHNYDFGIQHLRRLLQVRAIIHCKDGTDSETKSAEAAIRGQVSQIPSKQDDNSTTSTVDVKISVLPESSWHLPSQVIQFAQPSLETSIEPERVMNNALAEVMQDLDCVRSRLEPKSYDELQLMELFYDIGNLAQDIQFANDPGDEYVDRIKYFQEEVRKLPGGRCCVELKRPAPSSHHHQLLHSRGITLRHHRA